MTQIYIPIDIALHIYSFLPPKEIALHQLICKGFYQLLNSIPMKRQIIDWHCRLSLYPLYPDSILKIGSLFRTIYVIEKLQIFSSNLSHRHSKITPNLLLPPRYNQVYDLNGKSVNSLELKCLSTLCVGPLFKSSPTYIGGNFIAIGTLDGGINIIEVNEQGDLIPKNRYLTGKKVVCPLLYLYKGFFAFASDDHKLYVMHIDGKGSLKLCSMHKLTIEDNTIPEVSVRGYCYLGDGYFAVYGRPYTYLMHIDDKGNLRECDRHHTQSSNEYVTPFLLREGFLGIIRTHVKDFDLRTHGSDLYVMKVDLINEKLVKCCSIVEGTQNLTPHLCPINQEYLVVGSYDSRIYLKHIDEQGKTTDCDKYYTVGEVNTRFCYLGNNLLIFLSDSFIYLMRVDNELFKELDKFKIKGLEADKITHFCPLGKRFFSFEMPGYSYVMHINDKNKLVMQSCYETKEELGSLSQCYIGDDRFIYGSKKGNIRLMQITEKTKKSRGSCSMM